MMFHSFRSNIARLLETLGFCKRNRHPDFLRILNASYQVLFAKGRLLIGVRDNNFNCSVVSIRPDTSDIDVFFQIFVDGEYEYLREATKIIGDVEVVKNVFDIGANIGLSSVFFAALYPNAQVLAVEPDASNFNMLERNAWLNKRFKIKCLQAALWTNDTSELQITNEFRDGRNWSFVVKPGGSLDESIVIGYSIESLLEKNLSDDEILDVLKMDIEGTESILFEDNAFLRLVEDRVRLLCLEIHDEFDCREVIMRNLSIMGFECYHVGETTFCLNNAFSCR